MNCDDAVYTREQVIELQKLAEKEAKIQLCNWFLQVIGSGLTYGMSRRLIYNKLIEIKGEGDNA